jgi:hypothetical protein
MPVPLWGASGKVSEEDRPGGRSSPPDLWRRRMLDSAQLAGFVLALKNKTP